MTLFPVILSGGSGTRLWPLSRASLPKQLLPLVSDLSLLQETALRASRIPNAAAPLLVCNEEHRFLVAEQLSAIAIKPQAIILEPVGRSTAAAIATAAMALMDVDPEAVLVVMPSDHVIADEAAFTAALSQAEWAATRNRIVTFGLTPTNPATGFGYIECGLPLATIPGCHEIVRFQEKPDLLTATRMAASGKHYWNSGIFVFSAAHCIAEMTVVSPTIVDRCRRALTAARRDLEFTRLDPITFATVPAVAFDRALMEHTRLGAVVPVSMGWSDVGCWNALWEIHERDLAGNVVKGDVITHATSSTLIHAQNRMVAAVGVKDLVIVETKDAVLVTHKSASQDVQKVVERLRAGARTEHLTHQRTYRPWGYYESVDNGERFQVKRLMVTPGAKLSMQIHHHRAEHWVVVKGTARVWRGEEVALLSENQSTYISIGMPHRLENPGKVPLHIIEVQSGCYLGEDDIVRLDDVYNRAPRSDVGTVPAEALDLVPLARQAAFT